MLLDFPGYDTPFLQTRYGRNKFQKRNGWNRFMRTRGMQNGFNGVYNMADNDFVINDADGEDVAEYVNEEANLYEQMRQKQVRIPAQPKQQKRPVNKMEKIIGSIYKMSMYQVILVSNANPKSHSFYSKRWGIGRDVTGFINRLLFGGIYTMRMKEWLKRFDDKHLFYRESSELFDNPVGLMQDLEKYLGVSPLGAEKWKSITAKVYNVELEKGKGYAHKEQDVQSVEHWDITKEMETKIPHPTEDRKWQSQEIITMLRNYYKTHNQQLSDLFDGVKYKDWDYPL